jgi:hypothetical protein
MPFFIGMAGTDPRIKSGDGHDEERHVEVDMTKHAKAGLREPS